MLQKLPVNSFEQIKDASQFNEDFIKTFNEESDKEYFLEVNVQHLEKLHEFHNGLPFLSEKVKIVQFVANLHYKTEYTMTIKNLKQTLNYRLVLKNLDRILKFNQMLN